MTAPDAIIWLDAAFWKATLGGALRLATPIAFAAIGEKSIFIAVQGGQIEVLRVRYDTGKKIPAPQFCAEQGVQVGAQLE